jgi:hypothetical protein
MNTKYLHVKRITIILCFIIIAIIIITYKLNIKSMDRITATNNLQSNFDETRIASKSQSLPTKTNIENSKGMAIHIIVLYWDQTGPVNTSLGSFNPAIGKKVRMKVMSDSNSIQLESSGITNENGLTLLTLVNPIIDKNGNTQKVNISIDDINGNISCSITPVGQGYYVKEIYLKGNMIWRYYP